jgi:transcriptional regulator with XRE-family HTH domain
MLAERIETSVHFISLIERGVNAPSFETIETLAAALHLDVKELFDFQAKDSPPKKLRRKLRNG